MLAPTARFATDRGVNEVWLLSDSFAISRVVGTLDVTMARWFLALTEQWIARKGGVRCAFQDWGGMTDYEMQARLMFGAWMLQNRGSFEAIHILVHSKVIELGVALSNLALGRFLVTHESRETFDAELRACAARRGVSLPALQATSR